MRAPAMDLDDPFKDPMASAAAQFVTPLALFAEDDEIGGGERFGPSSVSALKSYAEFYCSSRLSSEFFFAERFGQQSAQASPNPQS